MKRLLTTISLTPLFLVSASNVLAGDDIDISIQTPNQLPKGAQNIGSLIGKSLGLILILVGLITFMYLIWGGIEWIISGGDKGKVESAQHRIQAALLGLFIVFAAWAIMSVVGQFFGFSLTSLKIPTL